MAKNDSIVQELILKLGVRGDVPDDYFDETIHDLFSARASNVNNGGFTSQLNCMLEQWGEDDTRKAVANAILMNPKRGEDDDD